MKNEHWIFWFIAGCFPFIVITLFSAALFVCEDAYFFREWLRILKDMKDAAVFGGVCWFVSIVLYFRWKKRKKN